MGFPRQEYWSGLPFPPPGDLPDPGIKPASFVSPALAGRFFTASATLHTVLVPSTEKLLLEQALKIWHFQCFHLLVFL